MFGLIDLYKPRGCTSRDCVNAVSRNLRTRSVGHAGTLDPIAEGVLVVAVGAATRLVEYVQQQPKSYRGKFRLGLDSPSADTETEAITCGVEVEPTRELLEAACSRFVGRIEQTPPIYSAVKIGGTAAYALARRGEAVEVPSREVEVFSCELTAYEYPDFELAIRCGSGTYIRSIGRDLARSLGTSAIMTSLIRTAVGVFTAEDAVPLDRFRSSSPQIDCLRPAGDAVGHLHRIAVTEEQARRLMHGQMVELPDAAGADIAAAFDGSDRLVGLVERRGGCWKSLKNFPPERQPPQADGRCQGDPNQ